VQAETFNDSKGISVRRLDGTEITVVNNIKNGTNISFKDIDLTNVDRLTFKLQEINAGGIIEIRSGSSDGKLLGKAEIKANGSEEITTIVQDATGLHDLYFIFKSGAEEWKTMFELDWIYFHQQKGSLSMK
jgi:cytochrome c